jgi:hypothetical protein
MCGLVAYRLEDGDADPATWMGFDLLEGAYDTPQCIRVLDGLGERQACLLARERRRLTLDPKVGRRL